VAGQTGRALASAADGWAELESASRANEAVFARITLAQAETLAMYLRGQLEESDRRTESWLRQNLKAPEWAGDAIAATYRGWATLAIGHPGPAVRWLAEAVTGLERRDPAGIRGLSRLLLATACALSGDVGRARGALEEQSADPHGVLPIFEPLAGLALACVAGAEGRPTAAGTILLEAAARAAEQGQSGIEALLLHRSVQFGQGAAVADRLRDLAARLDAPFLTDLAVHAAAAAAGDGTSLGEASRRLEASGALMLAADAAAEAAAAYQRVGARRPTAEWTGKATALALECGVAAIRGSGSQPSSAMTSRELEVARLASQGLSNQAIADRLYLSVRTVETHLSHVYTKLGISGREALGAVISARPAPSGPPSSNGGWRNPAETSVTNPSWGRRSSGRVV
jgi:DNA-binding NarL/FixJ family response regulator